MMPSCGRKDCFWFKRSYLGMQAIAEFKDIYNKERYLVHPCNECKFDEKYLVKRFRESLTENYIKNRRSKNAWVFKHEDLRIKEPDFYGCFYCKNTNLKTVFEIHSEFKSKEGGIVGCVGNKICIDCLSKMGKEGLKQEQAKLTKQIEDMGV